MVLWVQLFWLKDFDYDNIIAITIALGGAMGGNLMAFMQLIVNIIYTIRIFYMVMLIAISFIVNL